MRCLVHILTQLFTLRFQIRDQLRVPLIVDYAVELVAIIRDETDGIDRHLVNSPLAAALVHQVVDLGWGSVIFQSDGAEHLGIVGPEVGLFEEFYLRGLRLLADLSTVACSILLK